MKPLSEEEIADGWIEPLPYVNPIDDNTEIDAMMSGGTVVKNVLARDCIWGPRIDWPYIVAYRVVDQGEALKAAVHAGVDKLGGQDKAMGDDKPAKDLRQSVTVPYPIDVTKLEAAVNRIDAKVKEMADEIQAQQMARFSHHDTAYTTHVFYDEHPIAMITDDVISWSYHMPDMKKAACEAMHVYLGRVWK